MPIGASNKLIIADTSCLIAFANIGRLEILRDLCHIVTVTPEVAAEYKDPLPEWVLIVKVKDTSKIVSLKSFLGPGESSAIALALESENPLLILDDKKAQANTQGLLDNTDGTLSALKAAGFWLPANLDQFIK
jgi:predicted nucleic acid-binding protein